MHKGKRVGRTGQREEWNVMQFQLLQLTPQKAHAFGPLHGLHPATMAALFNVHYIRSKSEGGG